MPCRHLTLILSIQHVLNDIQNGHCPSYPFFYRNRSVRTVFLSPSLGEIKKNTFICKTKGD